MMKKLLILLSFWVSAITAVAEHTKGGWMYYTYLGPGNAPNTAVYRITLKIYTKCILDNPAQYCPTVVLSIFSGANNLLLERNVVGEPDSINFHNCPDKECHECISPLPAPICYKITTYEYEKQLPITPYGYTIAYQRCCRISGIVNLKPPTFILGDTWTVNIPGNAVSPLCPINSSARFRQNDTAIICKDNYFTFDFGAVDPNNDSLSYQFTPSFDGTPDGVTGGSCANEFALPPPYNSVAYVDPFTGSEPLGRSVHIDPRTGIVSGVAPPISGVYAVTVTVTEYIRGTTIKRGEVRKSLHIEVADCVSTKALLEPGYINCKDFTMQFQNLTSANTILYYDWDFGDPASGSNNTSKLQFPTHTYSGPGDYILKLVVNKGLSCSDSTTAIVKVYPVFAPDFSSTALCAHVPVQFTDLTTTTYGMVNYWSWNFGDFNAIPGNDTASIPNPVHQYSAANTYDIHLIVANNKGCRDTVLKTVLVNEDPGLTITHDTLMCISDTLQLNAGGSGTFVWTPNYNISNTTINNPLVSPVVTTTYKVALTGLPGCTVTDSVKVNVVNHVTQFKDYDTVICRTDAITLHVSGNALHYQWQPANGSLNNTHIQKPVATPLATTAYTVTGSIGKCSAVNSVYVTVIPYPAANAGGNQTVCLGNSIQLHASGGSTYSWSPAAFLNDRFSANPVVQHPTASVKYVLSVTDTLGCPKAARDTILLTVANIKADAGPADTAVVLGQPLQLNATGSTNYAWSPAQWLSNAAVSNPVALPQNDILYSVRVSNAAGCFDTDTIHVHVFTLDAGIYLPNAFTPNGDGVNDYFRPILIGMQSLSSFAVYNRLGQLVYNNTDTKTGWDGMFGGKPQDSGTYVWFAEGIDYKNHKVKKKGYVVLIR
ncbi:MAG: gliding motility-associated C-terminal domain-containing protein [Bacteroidetes bacterium]|nr:gliding motility-associated C-terminal domain-containing protein [Bacteroidota bacterium]